MLAEVVRLQRLPLAELLPAPVAAQHAGAFTVDAAALLAGRAVGRHRHGGAVPLLQLDRGPRRRAPAAAAGAAVLQPGGPRGARRARAQRADEGRRHAARVGVGVVRRGRGAAEAGDLELAPRVAGAEHDLVRDRVEELAAADGPRAVAAGRLPRVPLAPVDDVAQVGDGPRASRPRRRALRHDRRQVPAAGGGYGLGPRHVHLRRRGPAVQRLLEREPHRRRRRSLLLLSPDATTRSTRAPPPLAHLSDRGWTVSVQRALLAGLGEQRHPYEALVERGAAAAEGGGN
jgi:hypothetical protein